MTICLGRSFSFGLPRVPFVNCCHFMYVVLSLLVLRKELFFWFTARAFRKLLSIYVCSSFYFGFESRIWDLIVSVPDHCLLFYFKYKT